MMKYIRREVTTKVGEGELANLLAKRQAINNAVQSLNLLFQNWRENVYRAEKYGNITIASDDNAESDTVRLSVPFIITFRWDAYGVFLSKVRNVLSQIAIDKTRGEYDKKQGDDFLKTNYPMPYIDCTPYNVNNWIFQKFNHSILMKYARKIKNRYRLRGPVYVVSLLEKILPMILGRFDQ